MSRGIIESQKRAVDEDREDLRCVWCGVVSGNAYLLGLNHNPDSPRSVMEERCTSQMLLSNHITFTLRRLREAPTMGTKQSVVLSMRRQLAEEIEAAIAHKVDVEALMAPFKQEVCGRCQGGTHDRCDEDLTWSDIVEDSVDCSCWLGGHTP